MSKPVPSHLSDDTKLLSLHPGGLALTLESAAKAGFRAGDRILDIGCGTGASLRAITEQYGIIPYGLEPEDAILTQIGQHSSGIHLSKGNAVDLPYPDCFFDGILMECVLTLLDDPQRALDETKRVLKNGGVLVLSTLAASLPEDSPPCTELVSGGLACPQRLTDYLEGIGFVPEYRENRRDVLIQYMAESILEYGGLNERIAYEVKQSGTSVLNCDYQYDPKNTTYLVLILRLS